MSEYREIMTTNEAWLIVHLTQLKPKPVEITPLQGVSFSCTGPLCTEQDEATPFQLVKAEGQGPMYSEVWCARCGAVYLITWKQGDEPIRVERRGWRNVECNGWYGRLYGHLNEETQTQQKEES
jgi:hypothetical protein